MTWYKYIYNCVGKSLLVVRTESLFVLSHLQDQKEWRDFERYEHETLRKLRGVKCVCYLLVIEKIVIITHNVNGSHRNRGNPRCSCCCGFEVLVYLNIEYTKGFNYPKSEAEDQEAGEQDEPGVATIRSYPCLLSLHWRVHADLRWCLQYSND